jgi:hypothetical protein
MIVAWTQRRQNTLGFLHARSRACLWRSGVLTNCRASVGPSAKREMTYIPRRLVVVWDECAAGGRCGCAATADAAGDEPADSMETLLTPPGKASARRAGARNLARPLAATSLPVSSLLPSQAADHSPVSTQRVAPTVGRLLPIAWSHARCRRSSCET